MILRSACVGLAVLVFSSCVAEDWPGPPPVALEQLAAEHQEWREERREALVTPPGGAVLWSGLWELPQGATSFGSDSALSITMFSGRVPSLAGTLHRSGQEVRLEPAAGVLFSLEDGSPVTEPIALGNDRSGNTTNLKLGALGMRIHAEPGTDRLWLRVWDEEHPKRESFTLPEAYPVDPTWRVAARFEPYPDPRGIPVAEVTGGMIEQQSPGELVFRKDGNEHRLIAIASATSSSYFVMMWDSTATTRTYEAGRYLRVPLADSLGWTTIDFNRAYNPPCVFTAYSVCGLPPRDNWLSVAVTAGEQRPETLAH